ncbi:hypothetical protein LTR09_001298 [Extremus antarcticus]|uniref:Uncharacterized protein n=1 Tax=Extremus antarcticus TaxID=702011 RepID=A0AAJ0LWL5_9PEZI|nr:hypothetical protein LTR09_001298 [Extremus antarcticus]
MPGSSIASILSLAVLLPAALAMPFSPWGAPHHYPNPPYYTTTTSSVASAPPTGIPSSSIPFPTAPTATGTGPIGTGTGTGTGYPYPTYTVNKREADALALEKRDAFQGPRQGHFPHYWPASSPCSNGLTPTAGPTGTGYATGTGTAFPYPTATGGW